jgi:hypothetical protein
LGAPIPDLRAPIPDLRAPIPDLRALIPSSNKSNHHAGKMLAKVSPSWVTAKEGSNQFYQPSAQWQSTICAFGTNQGF